MRSIKVLALLVALTGFLTACGGRVPSAQTAQEAAISYFKKYGRKYPQTQFGSRNLQNVTINAIQELSNKVALVDTAITFRDGHAARALVKMEKHFPGGWRVVSWEMVVYQ